MEMRDGRKERERQRETSRERIPRNVSVDVGSRVT